MGVTEDATALLRALYGWSLARQQAKGPPGFFNTASAAQLLGWEDHERLNLALSALKKRDLVDFQRGAGRPFLTLGFMLNIQGWTECETKSRHGTWDERIEPVNTAAPSGIRIFISHSSEDKDLAGKLIALIEATLVAPRGTIRCTSVPGYALHGGDNTPEQLRTDLQACSVVLGMLTTTGLSAPWLLLELGAAWAFGKKVIPLIGPGATFKDLPGPFGDIHALTMTDKVAMSGLAEPIAFAAGLGLTNNFPKMQSGLEEFTALAAQRKRETAEKPRPVTPPMSMPDDDIVMCLERWLVGAGENAFEYSGKAIEFARIDREAGLPTGSAARLMKVALQQPGQRWVEIKRSASLITLRAKPERIVDVDA